MYESPLDYTQHYRKLPMGESNVTCKLPFGGEIKEPKKGDFPFSTAARWQRRRRRREKGQPAYGANEDLAGWGSGERDGHKGKPSATFFFLLPWDLLDYYRSADSGLPLFRYITGSYAHILNILIPCHIGMVSRTYPHFDSRCIARLYRSYSI